MESLVKNINWMTYIDIIAPSDVHLSQAKPWQDKSWWCKLSGLIIILESLIVVALTKKNFKVHFTIVLTNNWWLLKDNYNNFTNRTHTWWRPLDLYLQRWFLAKDSDERQLTSIRSVQKIIRNDIISLQQEE